MTRNTSILLLILIARSVYSLDVCNHILTERCEDSIPICVQNAHKPETREFCRCRSNYYFDKTKSKPDSCQPCHPKCQHLTCKGPQLSDCSEFSEKYLLLSIFRDPPLDTDSDQPQYYFDVEYACLAAIESRTQIMILGKEKLYQIQQDLVI